MRNPGNGGINSVRLKFEMHLRPPDGSEGPKTPILIPYTKLSLFDFDEGAKEGSGREVSRPPWRPPVLATDSCHSPPRSASKLRGITTMRTQYLSVTQRQS